MLMIYTVRPGDQVSMVGPDGVHSEPFVLTELPDFRDGWVWFYRESDTPIVVERLYALDSSFVLHSRTDRRVR